jgi:hypothetical protein
MVLVEDTEQVLETVVEGDKVVEAVGVVVRDGDTDADGVLLPTCDGCEGIDDRHGTNGIALGSSSSPMLLPAVVPLPVPPP